MTAASGRSARQPVPNPYADPIATALLDVVVERGYVATSVEDVIERARASRADFDRRFGGKEDCTQKVFEAFAADFMWRLQAAYDSQSDWRSGLRAAAYVCADWMADNPNLIRFGAVEILAAENEMIRVRREETFQFCADLIDRGRAEAADPDAIPESTAAMAIGSIVQLLTHRLQTGADLGEPRLVIPELMYVAVRPYVGEEVAREELKIPPPSVGDAGEPRDSDRG